MRGLGGDSVLTPLQALDLWQETGSRRCYQQVCAGGAVIPVRGSREQH
jgi:hypothetical protein